jgi:hypothetical protein
METNMKCESGNATKLNRPLLYDRIDQDGEIPDSVHALVRDILDRVVEALIREPDIAQTGLRRHDLRVVVAAAHFACADLILGRDPPDDL